MTHVPRPSVIGWASPPSVLPAQWEARMIPRMPTPLRLLIIAVVLAAVFSAPPP
jgi:hypothetical protein